jgi:hypothetical protein
MLCEPVLADESRIRVPVAIVRPGKPPHENGDDSNADDDPHDVQRRVPFVFLFTAISPGREYWIDSGEDVRNGTLAASMDTHHIADAEASARRSCLRRISPYGHTSSSQCLRPTH